MIRIVRLIYEIVRSILMTTPARSTLGSITSTERTTTRSTDTTPEMDGTTRTHIRNRRIGVRTRWRDFTRHRRRRRITEIRN